MKNKYLEALDFLTSKRFILCFSKGEKQFYIDQHKRFHESKDLLQELVDKETPVKRKQVEKWGSIKDCCPKCDNVVSPICCYCDRCGQKFLRLDWSDE